MSSARICRPIGGAERAVHSVRWQSRQVTPIGVALLGLKAGARFPWETRTGEQRELTVLSVQPPAPVSA